MIMAIQIIIIIIIKILTIITKTVNFRMIKEINIIKNKVLKQLFIKKNVN